MGKKKKEEIVIESEDELETEDMGDCIMKGEFDKAVEQLKQQGFKDTKSIDKRIHRKDKKEDV